MQYKSEQVYAYVAKPAVSLLDVDLTKVNYKNYYSQQSN